MKKTTTFMIGNQFSPLTDKSLQISIGKFLPFAKPSDAWRRIDELQKENNTITALMFDLAEHFRATVAEPREIYLSVQEVRSSTVYIRWRRRGVNGKQTYLLLNSVAGRSFLLQHSENLQKLYHRFDRWALDLNLAHSLRLNEIKRIQKYLRCIS
jgi:hypothetical protein